MRINKILFFAAGSLALLSSCSSKLGALSSDNFTVVPNPLEAQGGQVAATINGNFPEKYMNKKAVVTVTPELRYGNGQVARGNSATFQGEKVEGNNQTISYLVGGHYTMKTAFGYVPEMQKSEMFLTFDAKVGNKSVNVPAVKVANGVVATSELLGRTVKTAQPSEAQDKFQRVTEAKQEANIKFLIQQANLRKSELKNNSVTEFVSLLKRINADKEGLNLNNIEVSSYASPDGGEALNDKLANKRKENTQKYLDQQLKLTKNSGAQVNAKYTAQDWEGFQELVQASDIQDKDVILRVLSMYKDPQEREQQIKNLSSAFKELADGILPQLRRSRLTANYEVIGRDDDQINEQLNKDASKLSVEEMLYAATLKDAQADKESVYKNTTELYPNDSRAYNNLATIEYAKGNYDAAKSYAQKALSIDPNNAEANANLGLIALQGGDTKSAEQYMGKGSNANGIDELLGNLHIAQGKYAQAAQDLKKSNSNSAALAQILAHDYAAAAQTLNSVKNADATTDYLTAILNARQGNNTAAATSLRSAIAKDASFAGYAANDLELSNVSK